MIGRRKRTKKVLVVHAHPVSESFNSALRNAAIQSLETAGHEVRSIDLYGENFEPVLSFEDHQNHIGAVSDKPAIAQHVEDLRWADALVLVYPTWWSGPPAMLKGWFDRVWTNEVAFDLPEGAARIRGRLRNIRLLIVITTHGSDRARNALQGQAGRRMILRGLRLLCARTCRTRWIAMYSLDRADQRDRAEFIEQVEGTLAEL
ncbi:MAG: NAD(P)H-dependent oxidoreductase [Acidimicrobiales bacterium]|jgi:putative NADPH-quinone reductase